MPATVIPVTGLNLGPVGSISQSDFALRTPRQVNSTDTKNISFGESVVLNGNNTYSSVAQFIANNSTVTPNTRIGFAVENTFTNGGSLPASGTNGALTPGGYFAPGQIADVLTLGTINVSCNNGTPTAGGQVYVRTAANASIPNGVVGGVEATADASVNTTASATSSNSTSLSVTSATGIVVGQIVTGTGIPANTSVVAIAGTTLTLSQAASVTSAAALNFASTVAIAGVFFKTGVLGSDGFTTQVTIPARLLP